MNPGCCLCFLSTVSSEAKRTLRECDLAFTTQARVFFHQVNPNGGGFLGSDEPRGGVSAEFQGKVPLWRKRLLFFLLLKSDLHFLFLASLNLRNSSSCFLHYIDYNGCCSDLIWLFEPREEDSTLLFYGCWVIFLRNHDLEELHQIFLLFR